MARVRSFPLIDVIKFGLPNTGLGNFFVPNIYSAPGVFSMEVILYGECLAVVSEWEIAASGSISNSSSFFTATTTISGSTIVPMPPLAGDETELARGRELYPIRFGNSNASTIDCTTALTMLPPNGTVQQPDAPASLDTDLAVNVVSGPNLTAMGTEIVSDVEQGAADFDLVIRCRSTGRSTGGPGKDYIVDFQLQTSPIGHPIDPSGDSTPVAVGTISIQVPDWRNGGTVAVQIPLYADTAPGNVDEVWLAVFNDGGGGVDYSAGPLTGTCDIVMTPVGCHRYDDSLGNPVWDNDANLLIPIAELAKQEP